MSANDANTTLAQTVVFYSFKGGHGRTTSLANVANLCARMGHSVLCIDLDLEAPGLSSLYDLPLETPGFVEYASDVLSGAKPPFDPVAIGIEPIGDARAGSLYVMPAGRFAGVTREHSRHYWEFMGRGAQEVFSATPTAENFWDEVRRSVFGHALGFDYVFVDLRSGFSPLSLIGLRQWPGSLAMFLSRRLEASEGTKLLLEILPNFFDQPDFDRVCVLTRRPRFLTETDYAREHFSVRTSGRRGQTVMYDRDWLQSVVKRQASFVVMQADPEVEAFGYQLIRPTGEIVNRPLLDDYLDLAGRLVPKVFPKVEGEKDFGRALISSVLQKPGGLKVFRRSEDGDFVNFGDMSPNIAFKVETLQNLLDHLSSSINGDLHIEGRSPPLPAPGEPTQTMAAKVLWAAGRSSGDDFGKALRRDIFVGPHVVKPSEEDLIARWCEFDSSTGWARLSMEKAESRVGGLNWCTISAEYNAFGRRDLRDEPLEGVPPQDLCHFLKGYISGVINGLIGSNTLVVHKAEDCMFHRDREALTPCRFLVLLTRNPHARHPEWPGEQPHPAAGDEAVREDAETAEATNDG